MSRQANRNAEYGDPADPEMRAFLTRISPLTNVAKLKTPVFIAAGAKDTRVPISQAEAMVKALKANGTPVWYVRFEDAGHQQLTVPTNDFSIYTWVMFVERYPPEQRGFPMKITHGRGGTGRQPARRISSAARNKAARPDRSQEAEKLLSSGDVRGAIVALEKIVGASPIDRSMRASRSAGRWIWMAVTPTRGAISRRR